jgi:hypothetical protein
MVLLRTGLEAISACRTDDQRHMIFVCRKVPDVVDAITEPGIVLSLKNELIVNRNQEQWEAIAQ